MITKLIAAWLFPPMPAEAGMPPNFKKAAFDLSDAKILRRVGLPRGDELRDVGI
jgi:hypothetical protein